MKPYSRLSCFISEVNLQTAVMSVTLDSLVSLSAECGNKTRSSHADRQIVRLFLHGKKEIVDKVHFVLRSSCTNNLVFGIVQKLRLGTHRQALIGDSFWAFLYPACVNEAQFVFPQTTRATRGTFSPTDHTPTRIRGQPKVVEKYRVSPKKLHV